MALAATLALFGLLINLCGCGQGDASGDGLDLPRQWQRIHPGGKFSFAGPADLVYRASDSPDSFAGQYDDAHFHIHFEMGPYADKLYYPQKPHYHLSTDPIDGKPAKLVTFNDPASEGTFHYVAALHFLDPTAKPSAPRLTLWIECDSEHSQDMAVKMLRSTTVP